MRNSDNKRKLLLSVVVIALVIGIGYAYLTSNLSINGTTEVVANNWNIHFENLNVKDGSVTASTPATIDSNNADITYAITLSRPKEYYEFTVDVKNDGTLPGKVSVSTLSGIPTEAQSVIDYSVTYTSGSQVNVGDILNAGAKKNLKIRVFYKDDISSSDLPSTNLNLNLTYTLQYVQSEEDNLSANLIIESLKSENSSCFTKYNGNVTDQVGQTVAASNVYFNTCNDRRHIIFGGFCWQMVRTTETGGIKMIYYGEPSDNKCQASRNDHTGITTSNSTAQVLNTSYLYGSTFTYDTTSNNFTLLDTITATWSDSTYENLIGKFTCKSSGDTCSTIYQINGYKSSTEGLSAAYTFGSTSYGLIGSSYYNVNDKSPSRLGYMFNKDYNYGYSLLASGARVGNSVSYSEGIYTLLPASGETQLSLVIDNNHHYTCNSTSSTCSKVRYYFTNSNYIEISGVANIEAALNEMLSNNDVNKYNSSIKGIIDGWYRTNLINVTSSLEDTVYCNARNILDAGGWNPNGGDIFTFLQFKNAVSTSDLSCTNETDQFALYNNKAKLTYPVAMLGSEEANSMTDSLLTVGTNWFTISPDEMGDFSASVGAINSSGIPTTFAVNMRNGIRPVVSLSHDSVLLGGSGTPTDPWRVE